MRVIDHDERVVRLRQVADLRQACDEAVHREHPVGGDEARARALRLAEAVLEFSHVTVGVAQPLRLAQADAVDDARVVEGVRDHRVALIEQRLEEAAVGVEAGGVEDHVLHAEEARQAALEFLVRLLGAADEAHRGHAVAAVIEGALRRSAHRRMVGEPEVVVGAQVDHRASGNLHDRALRALEHALGLVQALLAQALQLVPQPRYDRILHRRIILEYR